MARQSHCARLVAFWHNDLRFQMVGKMASYIWLDLVLMMERLGTPDGLRIGSAVGSGLGSMRILADMLDLTETELETQLEPLVRRGLLLQEADVGLMLPASLAPSAKAKAARINGLKGGRPRKDGSPPNQRSMMLPLPGGGGAKPMENPAGNQEDSRLDRVDDSEDSSNQTVGGEAEILGSKIAALAGVQPGRAATDHAARWLAKGATPELVLDTVHRVLDRVPGGTKIGSLRYFEAPIDHALAAGGGGRTASGETSGSPKTPEAGARAGRPAWEVKARALWAEDTIAHGQRWNMHPSPPAPPDVETYLAEARAAEGARLDAQETERAA